MIEINAKLRKWGNSFGIVVPLSKMGNETIREGEEVKVFLTKERNPLKGLFGALKGWKINAQKFKEDLRKEEFLAEKRKWKNIS